MKLLLATLVVVCLSGCSALSAISTLMPGMADKGISVDAQIGDRANDLAVGGARGTGKITAKGKARVTVTTSKANSKFDNAEKVTVNNYSSEMLYWLLAVVVLFVPSPLPYIIRSLRWLATIRQRMSRKASEQK